MGTGFVEWDCVKSINYTPTGQDFRFSIISENRGQPQGVTLTRTDGASGQSIKVAIEIEAFPFNDPSAKK